MADNSLKGNNTSPHSTDLHPTPGCPGGVLQVKPDAVTFPSSNEQVASARPPGRGWSTGPKCLTLRPGADDMKSICCGRVDVHRRLHAESRSDRQVLISVRNAVPLSTGFRSLVFIV